MQSHARHRLRLLVPYMAHPVGTVIEVGAGEASALVMRRAAELAKDEPETKALESPPENKAVSHAPENKSRGARKPK